MDLNRLLREIPDFPKEGVVFKDITPLLADPEGYKHAVSLFADAARRVGVNAVVGVESRGFLFAAPVALTLGVPLLLVRKPGKLPAEKVGIDYDLEYGTGTLEIHKDAVSTHSRVAIIDDVLATGGTAAAAGELVSKLGGVVATYLFLLEIPFLRGREKLGTSATVESIISP